MVTNKKKKDEIKPPTNTKPEPLATV